MAIVIVEGTMQEIEDKAIEMQDNNKSLYVIVKYNDWADIIESKAKYINEVRSQNVENTDDAYKRGWEDCKKAMMLKLQG
jgi:hypothetical protein